VHRVRNLKKEEEAVVALVTPAPASVGSASSPFEDSSSYSMFSMYGDPLRLRGMGYAFGLGSPEVGLEGLEHVQV